jgi:hypothetical protein
MNQTRAKVTSNSDKYWSLYFFTGVSDIEMSTGNRNATVLKKKKR